MDTVVRISAEDDGFADVINRIGTQLKDAFGTRSLEGIQELFNEAEGKFKGIQDRIKYIREELAKMRDLNKEAFAEESQDIRRGRGTQTAKQRQIDELRRDYTKEQKSIDRLIEALNKLENKINPRNPNPEEPEEEPNERRGGGKYLRALQDLMRGNVTGAFTHGSEEAGGDIGKLFGSELMGSLIGGAIATAIIAATRNGYQQLETENEIKRKFDYGEQFGTGDYLSQLRMSRIDFLLSAMATANSLRNATTTNLEQEVVSRNLLMRGYGLTDNETQSFDKFFHVYANGRTGDRNNMGSTQAILEILERSEEQGLLGVSRGDFTMLPEKIGQVQAIVSTQFGQSEQTDINAAINMVMAGQRIGGRFADARAADTFGKLNAGIANPNSPGMRAFVFEALRRAHPDDSYLQILERQQNGASAENLRDIMPMLNQFQGHDLKAFALHRMFGLDFQSASRLASGGNINTLINEMGRARISAAGEANILNGPGGAADRNEQNNTVFGQIWTDIRNNTASMAKTLAQMFDQGILGGHQMDNPIPTRTGPTVTKPNPTGTRYHETMPFY